MREPTRIKPASTIDEAWSAVEAFPLPSGDPRYVDCSRPRGVDAVRKMERILYRHNKSGKSLSLLFTGCRGAGKTTELFQLQGRVDRDFEVIYLDASQELDLNNIRLPELLLAIAHKTIEGMNEAGRGLPEELLENLTDLLLDSMPTFSKSVGSDIESKSEVGIRNWTGVILDKFFSTMKTGGEDRERMRRGMESNLAEMIDMVNRLLRSARATARAGGKKDLLFLIDSLDRIGLEASKELFLANGNILMNLKGNFIHVVPLSLLYDEHATLLPFDEKLILSMMPVYKKGMRHRVDESGVGFLEKLIGKRIEIDDIFVRPEETVRELILTSGGHLRDLMKLVSYACNETPDKIGPSHAQTAIHMLVRDYERVVLDEEYDHLLKTYRTQSPPNNAVNQKLIYNNIILVYDKPDGSGWMDIHPAVVKNNEFQRILEKHLKELDLYFNTDEPGPGGDFFISELKINNVRHLGNVRISLSENERKHLILTGKNGSGKTSLLESMRDYLDMSTAERSHHPLGILWKRNDFILAFFEANRLTTMEPSRGPRKIDLPVQCGIKPRSAYNRIFLQYLVNLITEKEFALNEGRHDAVKKLEEWFVMLEGVMRELFEDEDLSLEFDRNHYNFYFSTKNRERFDFNTLSDGYSAVVNIVSELIIRMEKNRTEGYDMRGIVLIDEIETHLHVELQKKILPFLTRFFPKIQFIVSTHSPFVITSLDGAVIYDLENEIRLDGLSSASYSAVVEKYFGVDKYSMVIKEKIAEYETLLNQDRLTDEDEIRLSELRDYLEKIPDGFAPEVLARLQDLKLRGVFR